ncbi:hypothetical protein [Micromonospora deserti]|uniref:hypothetical protein n=1 Tax=Micromonospora deserti TaxID=2070366 RepID=UPI00131423C3|nr:hypothetical protein [Micromonospora deserti]
MSGAQAGKRGAGGERPMARSGSRRGVWIAVAVAVIVLVIVLIALMNGGGDGGGGY